MRLSSIARGSETLAEKYLQVVKALDLAGVRTDADLLFGWPAAELYHKLQKLQPSLEQQVTRENFFEFRDEVLRAVSVSALTGDDELELEMQRQDNATIEIGSGVERLDEMIGGFGKHQVVEISGATGSGKTLLTLQVTLRHLSQDAEASALWLDTTGDFSAERAREMMDYTTGPASSSALDRLQCLHCFNLSAAHDAFDYLRSSINASDSATRIRFLVIDPITHLFSPNLAGFTSQGHAIMTTFMRQLSSIARSFHITVFIINTAVSALPRIPKAPFPRTSETPDEESESGSESGSGDEKEREKEKETERLPPLPAAPRIPISLSAFQGTESKPALGPSFTFLTDVTLWLSAGKSIFEGDEECAKVEEESEGSRIVHVAEVLRSRDVPSRTWCAFAIRDGLTLEPIVQ
ncbi:hypothetical protein BOTBODRAFT_330184 [Botryobasidium botryosum FD-172 SS1]|uniref:RecA family profile 1 domain-containing protein n=1 Tax=Botryobasidium botryosum (strain FD-172 SS1) TaxID=930990 RepID=A0A067MTE2_BOTB1|nr:hypothetical protein BOTBODRAFT_330184 [Botryobasidium botryosum FD-172 SS1]